MLRAKAFLALLLIVCTLLPACQQQQQKQLSGELISEDMMVPDEPTYTTYTVEKQSLSNFMSATAHIDFLETDLSWNEANTYYKQICVKAGDFVSKGDLLMIFRSEKSQLEIDALKLEMEQLKMEIAEAVNKKLLAIEEAKKEALQLSGRQLEIAQLEIQKKQIDYDKYDYEKGLQLKKLQDELDALQVQDGNYGLAAPMDGMISFVVNADLDTKVPTSKVLVTMRSMEEYYMTTPYDSKYRYNMEISMDIAGGTYNGTIVTCPNILPSTVSDNTVYIAVNATLDISRLSRRASFLAYYERMQDVPVVEGTFIGNDDNGHYVNVLEDGKVHKRYITLGPSNRKSYWVLSGVSEGQVLVKTKG